MAAKLLELQRRLEELRRPPVDPGARPARRRRRDRERDRPERRRQDDALQPHHRRVRARRGRHPASRAESLLGLEPHEITARGIARTFQTLRLFLNMTVKENVMAAAYSHTHAGHPPLDPAHARDAPRGAGDRAARGGAALVLRPAADGLPLGPARVQPLVREPAPARDRAGDGDEAAAAAARRARRRDEPGRDARDHRADRQAARRGRLHDPRDRARHARGRGHLRPCGRARPRREDRRGDVRAVATDPRVVEAYLGTKAAATK